MAEMQKMIQPELPPEVKWTAPEFHYHEKDRTWNRNVIIVAVVIALLALWQHNFLFIVLIAIATALLIHWGHQKPNTVEFMLDGIGFTVNGKRTNYKNMDEFSIVINENEDMQWNKLILRVKSRFHPHTAVFIPKNRTEQIRSFLDEYLSEIHHEDSAFDILFDRFKF